MKTAMTRNGLRSRLKILTEYARYKKQVDMATRLGLAEFHWNKIINGRDLPVAFKIREEFREITLEWLWLGETDLMNGRTNRDLRRAAKRIGKNL